MAIERGTRESANELTVGIDGRTLTSSTPGGIGVYTTELVSRLRELRPAWTWVIYSHERIKTFVDCQNVTNIIVPGPFASIRFRYLLSNRLIKDNLDVFWGPAHLLPHGSNRVPTVVTIHDLALFINPRWANSPREALVERAFTGGSIREANLVIASSVSTQRDIENLFPDCGSKIRQIYLSAPAEGVQGFGLNNGEKPIKLVAEEKYFLYLGDINLRKNFDTVLKAFEKVSASRSDVSLVIAGGAGIRLRKDILASLPKAVAERLIFVGYVNDREKSYLFRHAEAYLFPSRYEGFGIPVLEAMRAGGLVITSRESCLPEIAGNAALYLDDVDDPSGLADLMIYSVNLLPGEREELIQKGGLQASRFSWDKCAEMTVQAIEVVARNQN